MREWLSLPVVDNMSGEVIGMIPPRQWLVTNLGTIQHYDGGGGFVFVDSNGVVAQYSEATPWVELDEAVRWGFMESDYSITAMAV